MLQDTGLNFLLRIGEFLNGSKDGQAKSFFQVLFRFHSIVEEFD